MPWKIAVAAASAIPPSTHNAWQTHALVHGMSSLKLSTLCPNKTQGQNNPVQPVISTQWFYIYKDWCTTFHLNLKEKKKRTKEIADSSLLYLFLLSFSLFLIFVLCFLSVSLLSSFDSWKEALVFKSIIKVKALS